MHVNLVKMYGEPKEDPPLLGLIDEFKESVAELGVAAAGAASRRCRTARADLADGRAGAGTMAARGDVCVADGGQSYGYAIEGIVGWLLAAGGIAI